MKLRFSEIGKDPAYFYFKRQAMDQHPLPPAVYVILASVEGTPDETFVEVEDVDGKSLAIDSKKDGKYRKLGPLYTANALAIAVKDERERTVDTALAACRAAYRKGVADGLEMAVGIAAREVRECEVVAADLPDQGPTETAELLRAEKRQSAKIEGLITIRMGEFRTAGER